MTTAEINFAEGLDAETYYKHEWNKIEMDSIFYKSWIYAIHESQLPNQGSYATITIGDKPLVLIRGKDEVVRCFYNVCTHRGHRLVEEGSGNISKFVCPYHVWAYDTCGFIKSARGVPDLTSIPEERHQLTSVEVDSIMGFIYIRFTHEGPPLREYFGSTFNRLKECIPNISQLKFARRYSYTINGNWKLMIENYLECYHCAPTHPALADLFNLKDFNLKYFTYDIETKSSAGKPDNIAYHFDSKTAKQKGFSGWWLWPNMTWNVFPGVDNLLLFYILPTGPESCVSFCDYFFIDRNIGKEEEAIMSWETGVLELEDNALVESVHKGLRSGGLSKNIYLIDENSGENTEKPLVHFNNLITEIYKSNSKK